MLGDSFAQALRDGRALFNKRVAEGQRRFPGFDTAALSAFVAGCADPVVEAAGRVAPGRVPSAAQAVFDLAIEVTGHGMTQDALVQRVWTDLAPQCGAVLASQPGPLLGLLTNAVVQLARQGARPRQWIDEMAALAPRVASLAEYRALGQLLAWRAGLAHFRSGALVASCELPDTLALAAFPDCAGGAWDALRDGLLDDPWHGASPADGVSVGAFTGFGGDFALPPVVRAAEEGFWIRSAERCFLLLADRYGAVLHGASHEEFDAAPVKSEPAGVSVQANVLTIGARRIELDLPPNAVAITCNRHTVAVNSPYSYSLRLYPLR